MGEPPPSSYTAVTFEQFYVLTLLCVNTFYTRLSYCKYYSDVRDIFMTASEMLKS